MILSPRQPHARTAPAASHPAADSPVAWRQHGSPALRHADQPQIRHRLLCSLRFKLMLLIPCWLLVLVVDCCNWRAAAAQLSCYRRLLRLAAHATCMQRAQRRRQRLEGDAGCKEPRPRRPQRHNRYRVGVRERCGRCNQCLSEKHTMYGGVFAAACQTCNKTSLHTSEGTATAEGVDTMKQRKSIMV